MTKAFCSFLYKLFLQPFQRAIDLLGLREAETSMLKVESDDDGPVVGSSHLGKGLRDFR